MADREYKRVFLELSKSLFGEKHPQMELIKALALAIQGVLRTEVQLAILNESEESTSGLLETVMHALALQDQLLQRGIESRVLTSIEMGRAGEDYSPGLASSHLDKGYVIILPGGMGEALPYDIATAHRAVETKCEVLIKIGKPDFNREASAFSASHNLPVIVCDGADLENNIKSIIRGENIGTPFTNR